MDTVDHPAPAHSASDTERPLVPHSVVWLTLAGAGLIVFWIWQSTGIEHYLTALGSFCL